MREATWFSLEIEAGQMILVVVWNREIININFLSSAWSLTGRSRRWRCTVSRSATIRRSTTSSYSRYDPENHYLRLHSQCMTQRSTTYVFILKVRHGESLPTSSYSRYDTENHYLCLHTQGTIRRGTTYVFILKVRHGESLPTSSYSRYDTEKHYVFILNVRYGALPTSSYSRYDTEKHYVFILKVRHGEALRIHTQGQGTPWNQLPQMQVRYQLHLSVAVILRYF